MFIYVIWFSFNLFNSKLTAQILESNPSLQEIAQIAPVGPTKLLFW